MTRLSVWGAAISAAAVLACGGSHSSETASPTAPDAQAPSGDPAASAADAGPCGGHVTLRLLGVDLGADLTGLAVETSALDVASGGPLAVTGAVTGPLELSAAGAWRLGVVIPPSGATAVAVSFSFTSATAAGTTVSGPLDVCTAPVAFSFDPRRVDPVRCHVVVELDLARSVLPPPGAASAFLLPQLKVVY